MKVLVTGAAGMLGRRVVADAKARGWEAVGIDLAEADLTDALEARTAVGDVKPDAIVHCAAWTDVDGCAREPDVALRRNGDATGVLARAAAAREVDLVVVSTNEVFDGRRTDGVGYGPGDATSPINAYGASKLAGEVAAREAYADARAGGGALGIARTAWLYGPPGDDFPSKILAAAERSAASDEPLRLVADEVGSPSYTLDVADAIVELLGAAAVAGTHHLVNAGVASRADWARELFRQAGIDVVTEDVPAATWSRASTPPAWAVLEPTPLPGGEPLRPWAAALADYLPVLRRQRAAASAGAR